MSGIPETEAFLFYSLLHSYTDYGIKAFPLSAGLLHTGPQRHIVRALHIPESF